MADRLEAYADWLVANQDKRGTTEFDTVANAYKQMRQQPVDRSFSSAFQQGIDQPFENMATTARTLGMEGTADALSGATDAPVNYESATDRFYEPHKRGIELLAALVSNTYLAQQLSKPASLLARWRHGLVVLAWAQLVALR